MTWPEARDFTSTWTSGSIFPEAAAVSVRLPRRTSTVGPGGALSGFWYHAYPPIADVATTTAAIPAIRARFLVLFMTISR
jgi:hypothetical protein